MTEYIHLVGAEDVQRAASSMQSAADKMQSAANSINESLDSFMYRFNEEVTRLEALSNE